MFKMLSTTAIAIVLATTAAHAGLVCGWAQVDVGDPGRPGTGVIETDVAVDKAERVNDNETPGLVI